MAENYILECSGISKTFGGTQALKEVELHIRPGEVHALLGENGAGKSTLMKCIIGLYKPDKGAMTWCQKPYQAHGPVDAINQGISMIHQELNPEPHLTIAESIFLKRESTRGFLLDKKAQNKRAEEVLKKFNFPYGPKTLMKDLTLAQVQMIEIIKAVSCDAKLIIMDEPTSSLDSEETRHLFQTINDLKSKGVAIIYISHRMEEIFEICDRVSVFRDGTYVSSRDMEGVTKDELISMMVGRNIENVFPKTDCKIGKPVFRVEHLCGKGFTDISFEVRQGEILGISGLVGSGRSETVRAIFGLDPIISGKMYLDGEEIKIKNPQDAIRRGICMVNEDRKEFGLCLQRSIRENISLPNLPKKQRGLLLRQKKERQECEDAAKTLTVKCASIEHTALSLSGGNQQKVVLAKWIMANPKVLILDEPTRGVDVGAKSDIHALMCKFAAKGMAVIMISSELPEVMGMSDRILIYHEGRLNGSIDRSEIITGNTTQEEILKREFGGK
ncbi:sugar ABC transporter ATP-binding protein [Mediterraneibacter sp. NSJ-55]|uniref:Sugar ABC transporter ATP-binding protein n=1 Tax=Mediterraneibacter hominis TaxID=2763054 RepID=A0A923LJ88_9FIRM|nr:sugar ABC transporter ATP-binding protein [Mediterraneibacter hominis]MBC5689004.1 sugar ABC transporter ATP-binding protein [Mediterraneibacter hominis]